VNRAAVAVLPLAALLTLSGCVAGTNTSDNTPLPYTSAPGTPRPTDGTNPEPPEDEATVVPVPEAAGTSQEAPSAARTSCTRSGSTACTR
jgi:hypothetical protein